MTPRVLVLDADMIPCMTVARSLHRRGALVDVAGHTRAPISKYSRAVNRCLQCPNPLSETQDYLDWLQHVTQSGGYDLVIPVTERTMVPLSRHRDRFEHVKIAMPAEDSLDLVLDKSQTMALAQELDVPVPLGVLLESIDDLDGLLDQLHFPVVLKPSRSIGAGESGASQLQVSYAFDPAELRAGCIHALRFGSVLLQEYFAGAGVGIELIASNGDIGYAFQHRRLHEVPLTGGGSSLRRSEPVNPALLEASRRLVRALGWNGVAMVEFKLDDESGEFRLMEINGRFWGSLPLAVAAGADFPAMLLDLELKGQVDPVAPYNDHIYCRLLSRDLYWYEAVLRAGSAPPIVQVPSRAEVARELALFFSWRHRFDVQGLLDPLPGLVDIGRIIAAYRGRLATLWGERRFRSAQARAWRDGTVAGLVGSAQSMLFLCYGNINRSALADIMLRPYAEDSGYSLHSAGFHEQAGRPADSVMAGLSEENGLQPAGFQSTTVTLDMLRRSDIIFVMEKSHYDRVVTMYEGAAEKTFLLGAHPNPSGWPEEIDDPYGGAREVYMACYVRVTGAVDALKAMIAAREQD